MKKKKKPIKRSTEGLNAYMEAQIMDQLADVSSSSGMAASSAIRAEQLRKKADELLTLDEPLELTAGNEAMPPEVEDPTQDDFFGIRETLNAGADFINLDASNTRKKLAEDLNCLDMAIDAAESIDAQNSLEKMLTHQAAACHFKGMSLLNQAAEVGYRTYQKIDMEKKKVDIQVKLINASTRLINTFNRSMQTLQRFRTGGRQIVTVQHVNISGEAQAIVAGKMNSSTGGGGDGGKCKKGKTTSRKVGIKK
jgi:hypothetical protein